MNKNIGPVFVVGLFVILIFLLHHAGKIAVIDLEENGCEMTYMFEYPDYIKIQLKKKLLKQYPRYSLYLYGEGQYAADLRNHKVEGIPVLFIPGNAGSYKQVRSLASVALRKAETHPNHFNYFAVDLDEDFGGLYGGVLMNQVNFVHSCIRHILRMYKENPGSVVLIGHSMGGIIARALFAVEDFKSNFVSIVITIGTPHVAPIVPFDGYLNAFYETVNSFWEKSHLVNNVSVISLAGGTRDILVPARFCFLSHSVQASLQYSAVTTSVPFVWLTIDHLALCWCKQLVLVINRALFALIDRKLSKLNQDKEFINQILRQHFQNYEQHKATLIKSKIDLAQSSIYNATYFESRSSMEVSMSGSLLIPVNLNKLSDKFIAFSNYIPDISIRSCRSMKHDTCNGSNKLSSQFLPSSREKPGFFYLGNISQLSHIVISSKVKSFVTFQFLTESEINRMFNEFQTFSGLQTFQVSENLFTNVSLPMVRNCFDVFLFTVKKINCEKHRRSFLAGRIHLPWSNEDIYAKATSSMSFTILLKTHVPRPAYGLRFAELHIWKTDKCLLQITVQYQLTQTLARLFNLYLPCIPKWIYFWIVIILVIQIQAISDKTSSSLWSCITSKKMAKSIPLFVTLTSHTETQLVSSVPRLSDVVAPWLYDRLFPSSFVILTAFVSFLLVYFILEIMMQSLAKVLSLCLSKDTQPQAGETCRNYLAMLYILTVVLLFCLTLFCSPIAIYLLTIMVFVHCCNAARNCRSNVNLMNKLNFSKSILLFFVVFSFQTIPSSLVWYKVLHTSWFLPSDPFRFLVLLLIPIVGCVFEMRFNEPPRYVSYLILLTWSVGLACFSLDKLPYFGGCVMLATNVFIFSKKTEHIKDS